MNALFVSSAARSVFRAQTEFFSLFFVSFSIRNCFGKWRAKKKRRRIVESRERLRTIKYIFAYWLVFTLYSDRDCLPASVNDDFHDSAKKEKQRTENAKARTTWHGRTHTHTDTHTLHLYRPVTVQQSKRKIKIWFEWCGKCTNILTRTLYTYTPRYNISNLSMPMCRVLTIFRFFILIPRKSFQRLI